MRRSVVTHRSIAGYTVRRGQSAHIYPTGAEPPHEPARYRRPANAEATGPGPGSQAGRAMRTSRDRAAAREIFSYRSPVEINRTAVVAIRPGSPTRRGATLTCIRVSSGQASEHENSDASSASARSCAARTMRSIPAGRRAKQPYILFSRSPTTTTDAACVSNSAARSAPRSQRMLSLSSNARSRRGSGPVFSARVQIWASRTPRTASVSLSIATMGWMTKPA